MLWLEELEELLAFHCRISLPMLSCEMTVFMIGSSCPPAVCLRFTFSVLATLPDNISVMNFDD